MQSYIINPRKETRQLTNAQFKKLVQRQSTTRVYFERKSGCGTDWKERVFKNNLRMTPFWTDPFIWVEIEMTDQRIGNLFITRRTITILADQVQSHVGNQILSLSNQRVRGSC